MKSLKRFTAIVLTVLIVVSTIPAMSVSAATATDMRYGRTKLSANLQKVYDLLVTNCTSDTAKKISISTSWGVTKTQLKNTFTMFYSDYPEYFWVENGYGYSYTGDGIVTSITPAYVDFSDISKTKAEYNQKVTELTADLSGKSDYEKSKILHDRLCVNVVYTLDCKNHQNAYGALVEGKAVCNGYARAYQHLMNKVDIPAWYLSGVALDESANITGRHAWNLVKLDGQWYYSDPTWDDQGLITFYTYFNITEEQISKRHTADDIYKPLVPDATATDANYYKRENREFATYDEDRFVELLIKDIYKTQIYVIGDLQDFISSIDSLSIAKKLGATYDCSVSQRGLRFGNSLYYEIAIKGGHTHAYSNNCDAYCNICNEYRAASHKYTNSCDAYCDVCNEFRKTSHQYSDLCDAYCDVCNAKRTVTHQYTDSCDAYCNICNAERTITHQYSNLCDAYCDVCNAKRTVTQQYTNSCDAYCDVCNAKRTVVHQYSNSCDAFCDICDEFRAAPHKYTNSCDAYCDICDEFRFASHKYTDTCDAYCDICNEFRTAPHKYTNSCDAYCNICNKYRKVSHKYTNSCDAYCNVCNEYRKVSHKYTNSCDAYCDICYKYRVVTHKYTNSCDAYCNVCNEYRKVSHKYSNCCDAYCNICNAKRAAAHKYKNITAKATFSGNGKVVKKCAVCGGVAKTTVIKYVKSVSLSATSYTYNGKAKTPKVIVKDGNGKVIPSSSYTVIYPKGRVNVGVYKVTVKMKGNYSGTKTLYFKINPIATVITKLTAGNRRFTVGIYKRPAQVNGYQIQYSTNSKFKNAITKTIGNCNTTNYTVKGLGSKKIYYVRVRTYKKVGKTIFYSGWSTYKYVKTK